MNIYEATNPATRWLPLLLGCCRRACTCNKARDTLRGNAWNAIFIVKYLVNYARPCKRLDIAPTSPVFTYAQQILSRSTSYLGTCRFIYIVSYHFLASTIYGMLTINLANSPNSLVFQIISEFPLFYWKYCLWEGIRIMRSTWKYVKSFKVPLRCKWFGILCMRLIPNSSNKSFASVNLFIARNWHERAKINSKEIPEKIVPIDPSLVAL